MQLFRDLAALPPEFRGGAITIGNFDGVHLGHARLMARLQATARAVSGPAVVFTFDPHPVRLLRPDAAPPPLTWMDRKAELLVQLGIDAILAYRTDEAFLALGPEPFFQHVVRDSLDARAIIEGPNFFFGHNRSGNVARLQRLCDEAEIQLEIVEPLRVNGQYVSSSRVRELVSAGDVRLASEMLTHPYRIRGLVTHGDARGGKIGFPTANLDAVDTLLPAQGVYAGRAFTPEGAWPAAVNIGPNPTFGERSVKVEAHLLGFSGSLYGGVLEVDFLSRLRDIRAFGSVDELKQQLVRDVAATREMAEHRNDLES
ncbi:MAG: bifunctional riboflavin kinase/FAD synthetase [Pirellulaceae bacterium]